MACGGSERHRRHCAERRQHQPVWCAAFQPRRAGLCGGDSQRWCSGQHSLDLEQHHGAEHGADGSVSASPDPAAAGQDDLTCSVDSASTDADGDSVVYTYVWSDDAGVVQQTTSQTAATSDVFLGSGTTEGSWTCEVTPSDLTDDGATDLASVVVKVAATA